METPTPKRIDEAHSYMTRAACAESPSHETLGLKHRTYSQSAHEECYICALLRVNGKLQEELDKARAVSGTGDSEAYRIVCDWLDHKIVSGDAMTRLGQLVQSGTFPGVGRSVSAPASDGSVSWYHDCPKFRRSLATPRGSACECGAVEQTE